MDFGDKELDEHSTDVTWFRGQLQGTQFQDDQSRDYASLKSYFELVSSTKSEVVLRFNTIERLIGGPLPIEAFHDRLWWSNIGPPDELKHTSAWLDAGYVVSAVQSDRATGWVRFKREADSVKPYWMSVFAASLSDD